MKETISVLDFLAEWAELHPNDRLAKQVELGRKIASKNSGKRGGPKPRVSNERFLTSFNTHKAKGLSKKEALFKTAQTLNCYPKSKDSANDYRLLWAKLKPAEKSS
ncbi:MAG: hypothetical protein ACOZAA_13040 [Pseudomonadota bacterium]